MVKVNVAAPIKRKEIIELLESQVKPKYTYLDMISPIEMQFEVEETGENLVRVTNRLIHGMPYGNVIVFRVLYDGQFFDGGKIYPPDSDEYKKMRIRFRK